MEKHAISWIRALGLVKCLEILGEASGRISEPMRSVNPEIPWLKMIGMRNRLVHAYFEIDHSQVWKTIKEELPPLIGLLEKLLESKNRGTHWECGG